VVLLAAGADEPVTIGGSGGVVWSLLDRPRTVAELTNLLVERFPSDGDAVQHDLVPLLERLVELGAVEDGTG
jgi:Coenzyme PQQ synthesis protein D (PqqD)